MIKIPKGKQEKYLSSLNVSEVEDQVSNKEAIPELAFKVNIFNEEKELVNAEKMLMYNTKLNRGRIDSVDKAKFESIIVSLFNHIKYMMLDKQLFNLYSKKTKFEDSHFYMINRIERGQEYNLNQLLTLKEFLLYGLHKLKLTDLLRETSFDWEAEFRSQY